MIRNLKRLLLPLTCDGEPGLQTTDSRLTAVSDLADRRQFKEAADLAESLLDEQIYDIRPISVLLYQAFIEDGFLALGDIFQVCTALVGKNVEAVGPARRRDEHIIRRFSWLFTAIYDALEYHERKRTPEWSRWNDHTLVAAIDEAISQGQTLRAELDREPFRQAHASLSKVTDWIGKYRQGFAVQKAAEVQAPEAASAPAPQAASAPAAGESGSLEPVRRRVELLVSYPFIDLVSKLKSFETLLEKREYEKAALVADDIISTLDNFDPRVYFPELLGPFSASLSKNIHTLSEYWQNRDTVPWRALSQYYQADRKGFTEG